MPRRILLLITDLHLGGTPTVVRELALRLRDESRTHIHVACLSPWSPVADQLKSAGIPVTALNATSAADIKTLPRLLRLIRKESFDTIFSFLIHANALASAARFFYPDLRLIQSIQTTQPTPHWHWRLQSLIAHFAEKIVVPTPSVAAAAHDWSHIPKNKIAIIPNAIDPNDFKSLIQRDPLRPIRHLGFIGRLDPIKRIPDLIQAIPLLPSNLTLEIFGAGPELNSLKSQIQNLKLENRITFHGPIPHPAQALEKIDLLILPSAAEGFGLVLIEAMSARIPVIATNVPGIRDVIQHEKTGLFVPPANPARLAAAIMRLIEDASLRQSLIQTAAMDVNNRFTWPKILPQYRALLDLNP